MQVFTAFCLLNNVNQICNKIQNEPPAITADGSQQTTNLKCPKLTT